MEFEIDALTDRLTQDGFVLLQRFCSAAFVERILDKSRQRSREVHQALAGQEIGIGSAAGFAEIVQRSPGRWDIPIAPPEFGFIEADLPWMPLVHRVLGDDAEYTFSGAVYSEPDTPAQYWHTDSPHLAAEHLPAHALNVMLALHEVTVDMGPTEVARGSHLLTNHLRNQSLVCKQLIYQHPTTSPETLVAGTTATAPEPCAARLPTGTCLVFDDRLLHRGLANRSSKPRYMAYFSYRRKGYVENTHFESRRSVFSPTSGSTS